MDRNIGMDSDFPARSSEQSYEPEFVHLAVEAHARTTPDKIALVFEQETLSYQELNKRANSLSHWLIEQKIRAGTPVGLFMERSPELVVAILAVLKAGGAFVPFAKEYPDDRIAHMLNDSGIPLVLTHSGLSDRLIHAPAKTGAIDHFFSSFQSEENIENPEVFISPNDPAYCIYTSGSTGLPKGVLIPHSALINYLRGIKERLSLTPGQSMAMVSTVAADLGHTTLFGSLFCGSTLHLISSDRAMDGDAFGEYMAMHGVDVLKIVPSHLQALLQSAQPADVLPNQRLILGGEACRWELINKIRHHKPACRIFNHYGPTETTVGVLTSEVQQPITDSATIPTGKPLPNVHAYILDEQLRAVAPGDIGELYIGGRCLALGYHNQPELTAKRFIENPFAEGTRLYKTGDRVFSHADGTIQYVGRIDHQLKIRGFRVELGEIENQLRQQDNVSDALVVADPDQPDNPLIAYIIPRQLNVLDDPKQRGDQILLVRESLKKTLPDYMWPAHYMLLATYPLTPNGKLDRNALPKPEKIPEKREITPPVTDTEKSLCDIWKEILNIDAISITDNFFDLGGHSLLATEAVSKIRSKLRLRLRLAEFFDAKSLSELATLIEQKASKSLGRLPDNQNYG